MTIKQTILIAETDERRRRTLAAQLAELGHDPRAARSVGDIRQQLLGATFDAAVLAAELAIEKPVAVELLAGWFRPPVLVVVGDSGDEDAERFAREVGVDYFMPRPVDAGLLVTALAGSKALVRAPPAANG